MSLIFIYHYNIYARKRKSPTGVSQWGIYYVKKGKA